MHVSLKPSTSYTAELHRRTQLRHSMSAAPSYLLSQHLCYLYT